jgi:hypothetical protein
MGLWMAFEGLHLRLFREAWSLLGAADLFWQTLASLGVEPIQVAWPLITIGTAWIGAVCCVLVRLGGIHRFVLILGLISTLFVLPGTVLGAIVLICLWVPTTRGWLKGTGDAQD